MAPPDSPSLTFSNGSGVPILGQKTPVSHTAPNKLVKRTPSGQTGTPDSQTGRGSRQMPTLRRPATSHQRSATLQQFQSQGMTSPPLPEEGFPMDVPFRPIEPFMAARPVPDAAETDQAPGKWTSYFSTRAAKPLGRGNLGRTSESSPGNSNSPLLQRKVSVHLGVLSRPYLTKANWITASPITVGPEDMVAPASTAVPATALGLAPAAQIVPENRKASQDASDSADSTPSRRARKSISMHFSSPTSWISKTGSIRRARRGTVDAKSGTVRHVPAAALEATTSPTQAPEAKPSVHEIFKPAESGPVPVPTSSPGPGPASRQNLESETQQTARTTQTSHLRTRKRNSSSPLPPLSRLSSFNIDVAKLGQSSLSSSSSVAPPRQQIQIPSPINYMAGSLTLSGSPRSRGGSGEQTSTIASSDFEGRSGTSGDDEDTDFKSDGMFDSFRTVASSSRLRTVETPLESMFDESPPSTAGNSKTKRLSIQEILGRSWDGDTNIMEEEESLPTPIRAVHLGAPVEFTDRDETEGRFSFDSSPELSLANRDFGRLSLDDDDDDDWARDDENTLSNHLSPPSSSTNSRRVSPTFRHALLRLNANTVSDTRRDPMEERPRSNIFDWCEPSALDKLDNDGNSPRPKTVHGKQEMDLRGGRSVIRKGPSAAHVRSQSVPLVPDPSDNSKPAPKFGTWGLGTKTASEDWDDDFDFEEEGVPDLSGGGKDSATSFSMVVPASIQATQPTVKAHSGQIRELSLLVNDLKRLCRHGKDLDILMGSLAPKWLEAENIIALASPDEEAEEEAESARQSRELDRSRNDDRYLEDGFDGSILDQDSPFGTPERELREMTKTTVVRERQVVRRRSVFSPDDDIFGNNWPLNEESSGTRFTRPHTPEPSRSPSRNSAVIATVIEAMQQQRAISDPIKSPPPNKPSNSKLFFDTNSLQELVKRAGHLRDSLSDAVRRAELLTQSPAGTPRRERHGRHHNPDGSPAFTRVFTDPAASPPRRLPKSHSTNSVLSKKNSVDSPRMQMMTVN